MARYRARDDGFYDVETSAGYLPMPASDYELTQLGFEREGPDLRLANLDSGGGGTTGSDVTSGGGTTGQSRQASDRAATSVQTATDASGALPPTRTALRRDLEKRAASGDLSAADAEAESDKLSEIEREEKARDARFRDPVMGSESGYARHRPKTEEINLEEEGGTGGETASAPESGPRFARTPAFDSKATWQVQKGNRPSEELLEEETDQAIRAKANMLEAGDRAETRADQLIDVADRAIGQQERSVSEGEIRLRRMREDYAARQAKIDAERAEVDKLEVDPDRIFSGDFGTFARIVAGISILAGGLLMGLQGRPTNPGLDAVNNAIDRDVAKQKEKIARRRQGIADQETELERLMSIYGNPEIAERELRERQMSLVSAYAKRATMNSPEDVRINVANALAEYDSQRLARRFEIDRLAQDQVTENWKHTPAATVQVGGPRKMTKEEREAYRDERADKRDARVRQVKVDGKIGYVAAPEAAKDVQKQISGMGHLESQLADYEEEIKRSSLDDIDTRRRLEAKFNNIVADLSLSQEQGVTRSEDFDQAKAKLGSAEEFLGSKAGALTRTRSTREYFRRRRNQVIEDNVYLDPDAVTPFKRAAPKGARRE